MSLSGDTSRPVAGANDETHITGPLTASATLWVRVTNPAGFVDSLAATASGSAPVAEGFSRWAEEVFDEAQAADPGISGPDADPDGDGLTNSQENVFGSPPLEGAPASGFTVVSPDALGFVARRAASPGYGGRTRRYTLESSAGPAAGPWQPVAGFSAIAGDDRTVTLSTPGAAVPVFYRLRVQLLP